MADRLPPPLVTTHLHGFGERRQGKVRDVYVAKDESLVIVTTDRLSAFDHILRQAIPFKGQVLNRLAAYHFEQSANAVANHLIAAPDPNVTVGVACQPLPVEFVVRGYLAGHAWRTYRDGGRRLCGVTLPEGLVENEQLPEPILTPTTKEAHGHDEDILESEIVARGILSSDLLESARNKALALFARGTELAQERGLLLVDTKYEFGIAPDGRLLVIDEVHTPDSSRYFYTDRYEERLQNGQPQRQLSKEFVREWLIVNGFQGRPGEVLPDLPPQFVDEVSARYVELFEAMTGIRFEGDGSSDPEDRIQKAVADFRID
ncbi:phosphoribosylaminoimidazolesuccinocarboxamide synthase [soil metagenome]